MIHNANIRNICFALLLTINTLYSQAYPSTASEASIIPLQLTSASQPMIHLGGIRSQNDVRFISGLQFQPSKNLLIGGAISPHKIGMDLSIYYHIVIGYIPPWNLINISSNMFQIGMHRNRFGVDGDARWFSLSYMESVQFGSVNLNLCWNHLFAHNWANNTVLISTNLMIRKNFYLRPGAIVNFIPSFDYTPFLFLSIDL